MRMKEREWEEEAARELKAREISSVLWEGVRAVQHCQHRAAETGTHPLHFDAAHLGTKTNLDCKGKWLLFPSGSASFSFFLFHIHLFSQMT